MKLRKATIEDLENKCPDVKDLLENSLTYIDDIQELLRYIDENERIDLLDEIKEYFENIMIYDPEKEYIEDFIFRCLKGNTNRIKNKYNDKLSEEEQLKIFKEFKQEESNDLDMIMGILNNYSKDLVIEKLKENDYL